LSQLKGLKGLYLGWNDITDISPIKPLFNLEALSFKYNLIEEIPEGVFCNMFISLEYLDLSHNQISDLTDESFDELWYLDKLKLSHNQLTELLGCIFAGSPYLQFIDLSYNQINYVGSDTFLDLLRVEYLYLDHNQLKEVSFIYPYYVPDFGGSYCDRNVRHLKHLILNDNSITDISGLLGYHPGYEFRCKITTLRKLYIQNNSLDLESHCLHLPQIVENNPDLIYFEKDNPNPFMQDCSNDMFDLMVFLSGWLRTDCIDIGYWCGGIDFDFSGSVDLKDYTEFVKYWLE